MRRVVRVEGMDECFPMREGELRHVEADLSPLLLNHGNYYVSISLYDTAEGLESGAETRFDVLARCLTLRIAGDGIPRGPLYSHPASWQFAR